MSASVEHLKASLGDRYRIERELGQGGMATVYLAEDLKHKRKVAVKVLRPELGAALGPERFLREIETTANLRHPHILPLFDSGDADGSLFYVMPFVEGESLRDRLAREGQLPLEDAITLTGEIADALAYAHEQGVIHRDIKPENIMLERGHAIVADFGIARAVSAAGGDKLTGTGLSIGTPAYMSPEQAGGDTEPDGRSDLYSLASVLYEMIAGEPPYTGPTAQGILAKRLMEPVPRVSILRETVPPAIEATLTRALAKSPADRFPTVTAFAEALTGGGTPTAQPPLQRTGVKRLVWPAVIGVVATLALVFGLPRLFSTGDAGLPLESLAVLPLRNLSQNPADQEYFVDGMTEALINELSKIEAIRVISRTTVMQYRDSDKTMREIGNELGVDGIVEGSVVRAENSVRVSAQLYDASDESRLWGDSYDRTPDDILALHSDVAQAIAGAVRAIITPTDHQRLASEKRVNPEAHDLMLRARYQRRSGNSPRALELLVEAIALDSMDAALWAEMAAVHQGASYGDPASAHVALARQAAERAVALDPGLADAHATLGALAFYQEWDWETARRELQRAIALNPGQDDAHQSYGDYFEVLRQWPEAIAEGLRAKEANPVSPNMRMNLGLAYIYAGRNDEAIAECLSAADLSSGSPEGEAWAYSCLSQAYSRKGAHAEAMTAADRAVGWDSTEVLHQLFRISAYSRAGQTDRARELFRAMEARAADQYVSPFVLGYASLLIGELDQGFAYLDRAVTSRATYTPWINAVPELDPFRADPRFQALIARLGLPPSSKAGSS